MNKITETVTSLAAPVAEKFGLSERRKKILMETSKAHYRAMLDNARKAETIITEGSKNDSDSENQDGRGTQKT